MVKQYSHTTTLINRKVEKITQRSKLTVASRLYCAYMKRRKCNKILTCQRQTLKNKNKKINSLNLLQGIHHTVKQCRKKMKLLKQDYKKTKDHNKR